MNKFIVFLGYILWSIYIFVKSDYDYHHNSTSDYVRNIVYFIIFVLFVTFLNEIVLPYLFFVLNAVNMIYLLDKFKFKKMTLKYILYYLIAIIIIWGPFLHLVINDNYKLGFEFCLFINIVSPLCVRMVKDSKK